MLEETTPLYICPLETLLLFSLTGFMLSFWLIYFILLVENGFINEKDKKKSMFVLVLSSIGSVIGLVSLDSLLSVGCLVGWASIVFLAIMLYIIWKLTYSVV